jgi:hypothetical protein
MGWYINPKDMSKEEWLQKHMFFAQHHPPKNHYDAEDDLVVVCLVNNPGFSAAAICVSQHVLESFQVDPDDMRPKLWMHVKREDLIPFLYGKQIEGAPTYATSTAEADQTPVSDSKGDSEGLA